MRAKLLLPVSFVLVSEFIQAQDIPRCDIKIGSKSVQDNCFRWKTGSGETSDVAAMEETHSATFQLPNGKVFALKVKHNYLSSQNGQITKADFYTTQDDLTYSEAVDLMIQTWKDIKLYDALPKDSMNAIAKMKSSHGELLYPDFEEDRINIASTVRTLRPSKESDKSAKIWHVRFRISFDKD